MANPILGSLPVIIHFLIGSEPHLSLQGTFWTTPLLSLEMLMALSICYTLPQQMIYVLPASFNPATVIAHCDSLILRS